MSDEGSSSTTTTAFGWSSSRKVVRRFAAWANDSKMDGWAVGRFLDTKKFSFSRTQRDEVCCKLTCLPRHSTKPFVWARWVPRYHAPVPRPKGRLCELLTGHVLVDLRETLFGSVKCFRRKFRRKGSRSGRGRNAAFFFFFFFWRKGVCEQPANPAKYAPVSQMVTKWHFVRRDQSSNQFKPVLTCCTCRVSLHLHPCTAYCTWPTFEVMQFPLLAPGRRMPLHVDLLQAQTELGRFVDCWLSYSLHVSV